MTARAPPTLSAGRQRFRRRSFRETRYYAEVESVITLLEATSAPQKRLCKTEGQQKRTTDGILTSVAS